MRCIFTHDKRIFQSTDEDDGYPMIFEFANGGTLRQHLSRNFCSLTWEDKYKLSLEITNGLRYMHKLNIIHKDLVILNMLFWSCIHNLNDNKLIIIMLQLLFIVLLQHSYQIWYCKNY